MKGGEEELSNNDKTMKSKINFKILYLVLALYYLLPFVNYTSYYFQPYDETGLEQSTPYIVYLFVYLFLFVVFTSLFLKSKRQSYLLSNLTLIKLTLLFIWFGMLFTFPFINAIEIVELPVMIIYVVPLIVFLVPLFIKEKLRDFDKVNLQIPTKESLNQVKTNYEILFNTTLASIIVIAGIEILLFMIQEIISPPKVFIFDAKFYWKFVFWNSVLILVASLLHLGHEKYKKYIVSNVYSFNQINFTYTALCFIVYFLLNYIIDLMVYGGHSYLNNTYNYVALTILFAGFLFLYFRKGNRLMKKGESITHMAFSSIIYCMSFGLILWSMYHKLPFYILPFLNRYSSSSQQDITLHLSLGILLFLFNQKLSRFLINRSLGGLETL